MKLWLDADAAPRDVKDDLPARRPTGSSSTTVLVANQRLQLPPGYAHLSAVRVDGGPDVADRYIAEHAEAGDVAVTADIPLAALLVPKRRGRARPARRGVHAGEHRRAAVGAQLHGRAARRRRGDGRHGAYGAREKQAFANALDRALTRAHAHSIGAHSRRTAFPLCM